MLERLVQFFSFQLNSTRVYFMLSFVFYALCIVLITRSLLSLHSGVTFNDAAFYWNFFSFTENYFSTWQWVYGGHSFSFSLFSIVRQSLLTFFIGSVVTNINLLSYLVAFVPFLLCLTVANIVLFRITNNKVVALILPLFLLLNNFTYENLFYGISSYVMWGYISGLLILFFSFRAWSEESLRFKYIAAISLSTVLSFHPFFFVADVVFICAFLLAFCIFGKEALLKIRFATLLSNTILFGFLILCVNAFWIFPYLQGSLTMDNNMLHGELNNQNTYRAYVAISSYVNNISFITAKNDISLRLYYGFAQHFYYFLLLAFLIYYATGDRVRKGTRYYSIFLLTMLVVFFDLSQGPEGLIFGKTFTFLWENVNFFSFFRSFKRFFILIPVIYLFLFAVSLKYSAFSHKKTKLAVLSALFLFITFIIHYPFLNGNFGNIVPKFNIPSEYEEANRILLSDPVYSNIIVFPFSAYERYEWANNQNPIEPMNYYWMMYYFNKPPILNGAAKYLINNSPILFDLDAAVRDFRQVDVSEYLASLNAKYVLVEKDQIDENWRSIDSSEYTNFFDTHNYQKILSNGYFDLYSHDNYGALIRVSGDASISSIHRFSPTRMTLSSESGFSSTTKVNFYQSYNKNWKVFTSTEFIKDEGRFSRMFSPLRELKYIFLKPDYQDSHVVLDDYANQWTLELGTGAEPVKTVTIYFVTQAYFYLGALVSCLCIFVLMGLLVWKRGQKFILRKT